MQALFAALVVGGLCLAANRVGAFIEDCRWRQKLIKRGLMRIHPSQPGRLQWRPVVAIDGNWEDDDSE